MDAYLIYPHSYPAEGEMLVVFGREGVKRALATSLVFGATSLDGLSLDHQDELGDLMAQFDTPDEWSGANMTWVFEDGAVHVTRLAPNIGRALAAAPVAGSNGETRKEKDDE